MIRVMLGDETRLRIIAGIWSEVSILAERSREGDTDLGREIGSRRDLAERAQPVGVEEEQAPVVVRRRVVEAK